jgi:hypothetical protein
MEPQGLNGRLRQENTAGLAVFCARNVQIAFLDAQLIDFAVQALTKP